MKKILSSTMALTLLGASIASLFLTGCDEERRKSQETTAEYIMPPGFEKCKVTFIPSERRPDLHVLQCPNATAVGYKLGKTSVQTVMVDGQAYAPTVAASAPEKIIVDGIEYQRVTK